MYLMRWINRNLIRYFVFNLLCLRLASRQIGFMVYFSFPKHLIQFCVTDDQLLVVVKIFTFTSHITYLIRFSIRFVSVFDLLSANVQIPTSRDCSVMSAIQLGVLIGNVIHNIEL